MSRGPVAFQVPNNSPRRGMPSPLLTPFVALYQDMNRLLEDAPGTAAASAGAPNPLGATTLVPDINITETEHKVRITAEVPGVREADVEVMIDDNTLVIRAVKEIERQEERQNVHVSERISAHFSALFRCRSASIPSRSRLGLRMAF